jgi:hypothetical protein
VPRNLTGTLHVRFLIMGGNLTCKVHEEENLLRVRWPPNYTRTALYHGKRVSPMGRNECKFQPTVNQQPPVHHAGWMVGGWTERYFSIGS